MNINELHHNVGRYLINTLPKLLPTQCHMVLYLILSMKNDEIVSNLYTAFFNIDAVILSAIVRPLNKNNLLRYVILNQRLK